VIVAPLASCLPAAAPGPRPIEEPYFVMLGTIEPRKNHWLLLNVWRRVVERLGSSAPRLLIIGQRGWECENVVDMLERCDQLRGIVLEQAACADAELVTALHHARALLLPSFAEGFGIPAVEALSLGVPVIASDLAVFREFAGAVPDYLDPLDARGWMKAIVDYAAEPSARRAAQMERLRGFRAPTWGEHLRAVEAFLEQLPQ
jgi:glycosyltransferase involved in cell wall biosynthesis